jgi:hypothetical protein
MTFFKTFFLLTATFVFGISAMAQVPQTDPRDAHSNDDYFITSWRNLKNSITNYDLALSNLIPTGDLLKGLSLSPQYEKGSDLSNTRSALHHSTVDVWKLKLKANTDFLNLNESLGLNLEIGKDITYIQQFNTKAQSLFRLPYNPFTKLPVKSEIFFKKYKDSSLVYKEGDLLIFKAPMIISFGKGLNSVFMNQANVGPGVSYSLAGVFNIQVFRMKNNYVRVTINNSLEKSVGLNFGINIIDSFIPGYYILGFNALGAVISNNFFNPNVIQFGSSYSNLVNHSYDFIFNLNSAEAREQYDLLMGPKLSLLGSKNYEVLKKTSGLYRSNDQISKKLEIDFSSLIKMSAEDAAKPINDDAYLQSAKVMLSRIYIA